MESIKCASTKIAEVDSLIANPKNPNKHPQEQIKLLAKIIKHQGQRLPIVVSKRSGFIVSGHGRLEAVKSLGWTKCAVDVQEFETEADEYAHMIADNKIAELAEHDDVKMITDLKNMDFDLDLDLLGMIDFKLPVDLTEAQRDEDGVPEQADARCKRGDIWQLGTHRLMCGDSTMIDDVEELMSGEKADMVLSDPPYGVSVVTIIGNVGSPSFKPNVKNFNPNVRKGEYKEIIGDETTDTAKEFYQTCQSIGFKKIIMFGGNYFTEFLPPSKGWVIWNKRGDLDFTNTYADGEMAWSNLGHPVRIHHQLWNGFVREGERGKRVHPTQKPIALAEFCFDLMTDCKSVFDGFGGSGSTLIACEKTNRKCFMMELAEHYCDVILTRWEKYTGKTAILAKPKE